MMEMVPIDIPAPLHDELARMANQRGRPLEDMVQEFIADGLCREQAWVPQKHLLAECYKVMAQDNRSEGEGFLPLQGEVLK